MWSPVCDYITLDPREEKEEKVSKDLKEDEKKDNDNKN